MRTIDRIGPDTDATQATSELATEYATRRAARSEMTTPEAAEAFAVQRLSLAFTMAELGHTVTWDPPSGITSVQARWTCVHCGRAALQRSSVDPPYGSALTGPCEVADMPGIYPAGDAEEAQQS